MTSHVQAIAVVPGTHENTIAAAAIASALAYLSGEGDAWQEWMTGGFTKSVRRIRRPIEETKVVRDSGMIRSFRVGDATAYAYAPMPYENFPPHLRGMQVSGLDRTRTGADTAGEKHPLIILNHQLEMTTGKAAAQAAHALVLWADALPASDADAWAADPGVRIGAGALDLLPEAGSITIRDHGLTEIDPGSHTARILHPGTETSR